MPVAVSDLRGSRVRAKGSLTERLVYQEILLSLWEHNGSIPSDLDFLEDDLDIPRDVIQAALPVLLRIGKHGRGGLQEEGGCLRNVRVTEDLAEAESFSKGQAERGRKGGLLSAQRRSSGASESSSTAQASLDHRLSDAAEKASAAQASSPSPPLPLSSPKKIAPTAPVVVEGSLFPIDKGIGDSLAKKATKTKPDSEKKAWKASPQYLEVSESYEKALPDCEKSSYFPNEEDELLYFKKWHELKGKGADGDKAHYMLVASAHGWAFDDWPDRKEPGAHKLAVIWKNRESIQKFVALHEEDDRETDRLLAEMERYMNLDPANPPTFSH